MPVKEQNVNKNVEKERKNKSFQNKINDKNRNAQILETYGITIAPRSEIARPVAPFPLS